MRAMPAYDALAEWFEVLNDDCDYPAWSQYFMRGLRRFGAGGRGLELGCGSGAFSRILTKNGYTMSAGDLSEAMLSKGIRLAREEGCGIEFLRLDARNFKVLSPFDFLLAPNDCYNYVAPEALGKAFRAAHAAIRRGGIFWFDVSSPRKLREKVANTVMADDREEVTYLSFNRLAGQAVEMDVTLFIRGADGRFDRFDELHIQYIHEEEAVLAALQAAGFEVLSVEGHLGEEKASSDRLNFICRRM